MRTSLEQLLSHAKHAPSRWGIRLASVFQREIVGCLSGDFCPTKLFGQSSRDEWETMLKEADRKLIYCDPEQAILGAWQKQAGDEEFSKAIADFECVITTNRKDRDGDVMEPGGATIDSNSPLLWQHISLHPVGKFVSSTKHTKTQLAGRFVVFDVGNGLGKDAATLIEAEALRISHGFDPLEYAPLKEKDSRWHITKYEIYEVSLVSVPANTDAIITAFSTGKLHNPLVKSWAKGFHDHRPIIVPGAAFGENGSASSPETSSGEQNGHANGQASTYSVRRKANGEEIEFSGFKSFDELSRFAKSHNAPAKKNYLSGSDLEGSYEWVQSRLWTQCGDALGAAGFPLTRDEEAGVWDYCWLAATFSDHLYVGMRRDADENKERYFSFPWSLENGEPTIGEDPTELEVRTEVREKLAEMFQKSYGQSPAEMFAQRTGKAGAVISRTNMETLKGIHGDLGKCRDRLKSLMDQGNDSEDDGGEMMDEKSAAIAGILSADPAAIDQYEKLLAARKQQLDAGELAEFLQAG